MDEIIDFIAQDEDGVDYITEKLEHQLAKRGVIDGEPVRVKVTIGNPFEGDEEALNSELRSRVTPYEGRVINSYSVESIDDLQELTHEEIAEIESIFGRHRTNEILGWPQR